MYDSKRMIKCNFFVIQLSIDLPIGLIFSWISRRATTVRFPIEEVREYNTNLQEILFLLRNLLQVLQLA